MKTIIKRKLSFSNNDNLILICNKKNKLSKFKLQDNELKFINKEWKKNEEIIYINQYNRCLFIVNPNFIKEKNKHIESLRLIGFKLQSQISSFNNIMIIDVQKKQEDVLAITEGIALSNYTYTRHKSVKKKYKLSTIYLCKNSNRDKINELQNLINSVYLTRDLVNEPFSHLTANQLAKEAQKAGRQSGFKTTIFNKKKIIKLKMGGLLAVNKGSIDDPTFTIMEWKPKNKINTQPLVLVGKGIVFDTGGLSLKPTLNSMDMMKVDMGGAATVIGIMNAIASNKLNFHVIGIVPATDNRPSGNAYAPGDVIQMHNKSTVEVLNTDAEGRLILADALSYAKKYKPNLVIDLATLTGSAAITIGQYGIVSMHKNAEKEHKSLKESGDRTHERLAELPFWDDYDKLIKSDVADIKNLGGAHAGAITAGKFLSHFIDYPWIHLDIAGPTFVKETYGYRGKGATGVGVRLIYHFIKKQL